VEGQAVPNQFYVGQRLAYNPDRAESLDPISGRYLKALLLHWLIIGIVFAVGSAAIAVFQLVFGSGKLIYLVGGLWWLIMGIVAWWFPVWVGLSEWRFMVDGKADAAHAAFDHVAWAFQQRDTPVQRLRVHRLSLGRGASRDYLYAQDGIFRAYIACFAYGRDLYVGWTLWWRLSAVRWLVVLIKRYYQAFTLRGSELHTVHRYDSAKALREAVHGAAREGLDAATGLVAFRGSGTVGSEIAVDQISVVKRFGAPNAAPTGSMPA
jgi:hypothetical protein